MERDNRSFEAARVSFIGTEKGLDRFTENGETRMPAASRWRNNLTALSQRHNLYFMASDNQIFVYKPEFPMQSLRGRHALCLRPNLANKEAPGYLSSRREGISDHCINHLVVGDLGTQEILLVATDSGNVIAYYTTSIWNAIMHDPYRFSNTADSDVLELRPFFSHWVHQSAWGLAIHKEARMIAVSANTPNEAQPPTRNDFSATITVFAFALAEHNTTDDELDEKDDAGLTPSYEELDWHSWIPLTDASPPSRDRNHIILLSGFDGHDNNIPNISFADTPEDTKGCWLLSTDISGTMKLWQIWKGRCLRNWDFGNYESTRMLVMNHSYPGWNVAALDLRSFRPVRNMDEFIGFHRAPMYYGYDQRGDSYNITRIVQRDTPGASEFHPLHSAVLDEQVSPVQGELLHHLSDSDDEQTEDMRILPADLLHEPIVGDTHPHTNLLQDSEVAGVGDSESVDRENATESSDEMDFELEADEESTSLSDLEDYRVAAPDSPGSAASAPSTEFTSPGSFDISSLPKKETQLPAIAILHCSDSHVRLLNGPQAKYPHIFCAHMLRQALPHDVNRTIQGLEFSHMDRLNMIHRLPELGIVLIATQTGRVSVCSLTRRSDGLLGLRVDWILPTKRQERNGIRPNLSTLIGMAVGPVQGHLDPESSLNLEDDGGFLGTDRLIDGVPTTFDPHVVVLERGSGSFNPQRQSSSSFVRNHRPPEFDLQQASWAQPHSTQLWKAAENDRHFRLMLTYADMSILTYEIWRGVERANIAPESI